MFPCNCSSQPVHCSLDAACIDASNISRKMALSKRPLPPFPMSCRTLLLAGIATALIFGALSWKRLGDTHGKQQFTEVTRDASARVLRETEELRASGGDMFVHSHGGHAEPEPCGESCSKDHAHTLPVLPQHMSHQHSVRRQLAE